jgi:6-phosphogluconolactonase (cycloisomerase 2 family)
VTVSRDGKNVYVVSLQSSAVAAFARDKATGALTQFPGLAACVSGIGTGGVCTGGVALQTLLSAAVSRNGKYVYVASYGLNAVAVFRRDR